MLRKLCVECARAFCNDNWVRDLIIIVLVLGSRESLEEEIFRKTERNKNINLHAYFWDILPMSMQCLKYVLF